MLWVHASRKISIPTLTTICLQYSINCPPEIHSMVETNCNHVAASTKNDIEHRQHTHIGTQMTLSWLSIGHISAGINTILRKLTNQVTLMLDLDKRVSDYLRQSDFKSLLDSLQYLLVCIAAHKGDAKTFSTKSSCTTNSMQI